MIGGLMLLCATGAMVLIAWWSLERDDLDDAAAASGLLGLRNWSHRTVERKRTRAPGAGRTRERPARRKDPEPSSAGARQTKLAFDRHEMNTVADEIEEKGRGVPTRRRAR